MLPILFAKAHNKGYTKKDGTYVAPFNDKRAPAKQEKPKAPQHGLFGEPPPKPKTKNPFSTPLVKPFSAKPKVGSSPWFSLGLDEAKNFQPPKPYVPPPGAVKHPKRNEHGKDHWIEKPSKDSELTQWSDAQAIATVTPGGKLPSELNGVPFEPWTDHPKTDAAWDYVEGQMDDLEEPALKLSKGMSAGSGVIIEEPDGRVWIVHPSNGFAGYQATFPKGHGEDDLSLQANAIKEAFEESGLKVEITGLVGDFKRTTTISRYYRARRVGGSPADMGWESQAVSLVPKDKLYDVLNAGNDRDIAEEIGAPPPPGSYVDASDWEQVGHQMGSNPGGVFKAPDGDPWYLKFPGDSNVARNEVLAARLYAAAGVRMPKVVLVKRDGEVGVASKMIDGLTKSKGALKAGANGVADGFAADAWLANWDAVGLMFDNMLLDKQGNAVRIDPGGALVYRAQGGAKGKAFGAKVNEIDSLRDPKVNAQSAEVFAGVTDADITAGVRRILAVSDQEIRELAQKFGPGSKKDRAALADKLIARKEDLAERFPDADDRDYWRDDDMDGVHF